MNPALRQLGFDARDRVVILHADDVGMCQATLPALADLVGAGLISSTATMVPCPWFPEVATFFRAHPDLDIGVHLTLTCEYHAYRWGPLSTRDPASGLLDEEGYFHFGPDGVQAHGTPEAVAGELVAQVDRARQAGIDITHVDSHQLSILHPKFLTAYTRLAVDHCLPLMLLRKDAGGWYALAQAMGLAIDWQTAQQAAQEVQNLEGMGIPLVDHALMLPLDTPENRVAQARQAIDALPPGLTHFVLHPAMDTPELRAITPDWPSRVADYQAFTSRELQAYLKHSGVQIIGYRILRDLVREPEKGGERQTRPATWKN